MKREHQEEDNAQSSEYDGRKCMKENESSTVSNTTRKCFPIDLGILSEICSYADLTTQCSLYSTCKSIKTIMDDESFGYHHHSRNIYMLMWKACKDFNVTDKRDFLCGVIYRIEGELSILSAEIQQKKEVNRDDISIFCFDESISLNAESTSKIYKLPLRDSNESIYINSYYALFQADQVAPLTKFELSYDDRILIKCERRSSDQEKVFVDKCALDNIMKQCNFGRERNVQQFINQLNLTSSNRVGLIPSKSIQEYLSPKSEKVKKATNCGWCSKSKSKEGILFGSDLINKISNLPRISRFLILNFVKHTAKKACLIRIVDNVPKTKPAAYKNLLGSTMVEINRFYYGKRAYDNVKSKIRIRGNLEGNHKHFSLLYEYENYTGGKEAFIDVSLGYHLGELTKSVTNLYESCSESAPRDYINYADEKEETLEKIGKIIGNNAYSKPVHLIDLMCSFMGSTRSFYIKDHFFSEEGKSGLNKKTFKFVNGARRAEELGISDDDDDDYYMF